MDYDYWRLRKLDTYCIEVLQPKIDKVTKTDLFDAQSVKTKNKEFTNYTRNGCITDQLGLI